MSCFSISFYIYSLILRDGDHKLASMIVEISSMILISSIIVFSFSWLFYAVASFLFFKFQPLHQKSFRQSKTNGVMQNLNVNKL